MYLIKSLTSGEEAKFRTELDSHANSACVGCNATIIHETGRHADVSGFLDELGV